MYTYTVTATGQILRSDGAFIPTDPLNTDYAAYLAWVAAGNTATYPAAPTLLDAQLAQIATISAACAAAILAGFSSSALGAPYTYPAKTTDQMNLASSVLDALLATQDAVPWAALTPYVVGSLTPANSQVYTSTAVGTSGTTVPAWPNAINTQVLDGGAQWEIWTTPFWCEDANGNWAWVDHTCSQIKQVGRDAKADVLAKMAQNAALAAQVMAVTDPAEVTSVNWS
jgi:hypothetical protein